MPSSACKKCALRSEEHTSELQSHDNIVCRLLLEKNTSTLRSRHAPTPTALHSTTTSPVAAAHDARGLRLGALLAGAGLKRVVLAFFFFLVVRAPRSLALFPPTALSL